MRDTFISNVILTLKDGRKETVAFGNPFDAEVFIWLIPYLMVMGDEMVADVVSARLERTAVCLN